MQPAPHRWRNSSHPSQRPVASDWLTLSSSATSHNPDCCPSAAAGATGPSQSIGDRHTQPPSPRLLEPCPRGMHCRPQSVAQNPAAAKTTRLVPPPVALADAHPELPQSTTHANPESDISSDSKHAPPQHATVRRHSSVTSSTAQAAPTAPFDNTTTLPAAPAHALQPTTAPTSTILSVHWQSPAPAVAESALPIVAPLRRPTAGPQTTPCCFALKPLGTHASEPPSRSPARYGHESGRVVRLESPLHHAE